MIEGSITYSKKIADEICERISNGESLRSVTSSEGMPSHTAVRKWRRTYPEFNEQYRAAQEQQAESEFEDMVHYAESCDDIVRGKLVLDTKRWCLERKNARFMPHYQYSINQKTHLSDEQLERIALGYNAAGSSKASSD